MIEEWRLCETFPLYEVSNLGNVRNARNKRLRKPTIRCGNRQILLIIVPGKKRRFATVSRLVLMAFKPEGMGLTKWWHINGDRSNDSVDNLMWVTWNDLRKLRKRAKRKALRLSAKKSKP
jgi:hypothetical protein